MIVVLFVIYLINLKYERNTDPNPKKVEDTIEKRQNIKVPPIETTEQTNLEEQMTNNTEDSKKEDESVFEQKIQEDPKTPEYTQIDDIPKVLEVEEPTTDESMKKPEVIHNNLIIETSTETTTKDINDN